MQPAPERDLDRTATGTSSDGFTSLPAVSAIPKTKLPAGVPATDGLPFVLTERIGQGGMGVVYRGVHRLLGSPVAVKVHAAADGSPAYRQQLLAEARTTSNLNHPNIVRVFDYLVREGNGYFVMEYIPGKTLRTLIAEKRLTLSKCVSYAAHIAGGLAAAHEVGVVHRDLKPGNVIITPERVAKILDFGVAKVAASSPLSVLDTAADGTAIVGTDEYMSPEQTAGEPVDSRSDVFSFGAMLYEMLTGVRPFSAASRAEVHEAIRNRNPEPPSRRAPQVPASLDRLVLRCLRKEPQQRWQDMSDVRILLEEISSELDSPLTGTRTGRRWKILAAAVCAAVLAGTAMNRVRPEPPQLLDELTRVTSDSGVSLTPALSPDGKLAAFASDRSGEGHLDIWIKQVGGGEPVRRTTEPSDESSPDFSPDGTHLAYRSEGNGDGVYTVSAMGQDTPRLLARGGREPRYSPDGQWIAYWTGDPGGTFGPDSSKLWVIPSIGGQPRSLDGGISAGRSPIWSPDGKSLLFVGIRQPGESPDWWLVSLDGSKLTKTHAASVFERQRLRPPGGSYHLQPAAWLADGDALVFSARRNDLANLWSLRLGRNGTAMASDAVRLTFGTDQEFAPGAARLAGNGLRIAFVVQNQQADIWSLDLAPDGVTAKGAPRRVLDVSGPHQNYYGSVSADGRRLAYLSNRSGVWNVWLRERGGEDRRLGGPVPGRLQPKISPDGSQVASYVWSDRLGSLHLFDLRDNSERVLCARCGPPTQVVANGDVLMEAVSDEPDQIVLITAATAHQRVLVRRPPGRKLDLYAGRLSPDRKWLAFHVSWGKSPRRQIYLAPVHSGRETEEAEWIPVTAGDQIDREAVWSADGRALLFLSERCGFRCIWAQRLAEGRPAGEPFALAHFHQARRVLSGFGPSPSGVALSPAAGALYFALSEKNSSIWLAGSSREAATR